MLSLDFESLRHNLYAKHHQDRIGYHRDIPNEEYHSSPGVSKSSLDLVEKSLNHFLNADKVRRETPSMLLGTCVHAALLEPEVWKTRFVCGPDADRRTREWKGAEAEAAANMKVLIPPEIYSEVENIAAGAMENPIARDLLSSKDGWAEGSLYVEDPKTGILMRCRPDLYVPSAELIVDLKTTKCAAPTGNNSFGRSAGMFNYDKQAAMYSDCMKIYTGKPHDFLFIAVENEAPYNCAVYEMNGEDVNYGRMAYRMDLIKLHAFLQEGSEEWVRGYSNEIGELNIPKYMRRDSWQKK